MGGDQLSRPEPAAAGNLGADRRDASDRDGACNCSDHCNGLPNGPACRGNADSGADTTAADDGLARDSDANCFTAAYLDAGARCCDFLTNRDTGDESDHCAAASRAADGQA
jgi:hypothetical protein